MITNKHTSKIIVVIVVLAVIACLLAIGFKDKLIEANGGKTVSLSYETELFDTNEIIDINIKMDEEEWQEMLDNATSEEYYQCDVTVNGTTFYSVGIRPKGNTSLSSIANDKDNNRYSFKLEFDHFVDDQSCFGLDKLILNNNYADATNMKEAIVYDMFKFLGANASLYNYAKIKVNGEYYGIYLALEAVEDSFLLRNFGVENGELYKPDSMDNAGGGGGGKAENNFDPNNIDISNLPTRDEGNNTIPSNPNNATNITEKTDMPNMPSRGEGNNTIPSSPGDGSNTGMPNFDKDATTKMGGGGFSMGGGADLNYVDDELDSYSTIWNGAVTNSNDTDHYRVIKAIKNINQGTDLETYLNVDNVLKYMAVHSFVVNDDSLSGSMAHNYYLYESDGQLNIIPWDYNLSFGGMGMSGNASSVINDPIDSPFSITDFFNALLTNEEYLERYHEYYRQLVEEYVLGGEFDKTYTRIRSQIDELVKTDPNALYTYEEYDAAANMLYKTVMLRAESVLGQLNGEIPSTTEGQKADSSNLVDASSINISVMGTFQNGGFDESDFHSRFDFNNNEQSKDANSDGNTNTQNMPTPPDSQNMTVNPNGEENANTNNIPTPPDGQNMPNMPSGNFDPSNINGNMPQGEMPENINSSDNNINEVNKDTETTSNNQTTNNNQIENNKQNTPSNMPNQTFDQMTNQSQTSSISKESIIAIVACLLLVVIAIIFAKYYRKRPLNK